MDSATVVAICVAIPNTIVAIATLVKVLQGNEIAEKASINAELAKVNVVSHNAVVSKQIEEVKESINGKVDKLVENAERAAIAETLIALRPEKPGMTANPEEDR